MLPNPSGTNVPGTTPKRKQACQSCRQRKKRCDGVRPSCSLCAKWGLRCEYSTPASHQHVESLAAHDDIFIVSDGPSINHGGSTNMMPWPANQEPLPEFAAGLDLLSTGFEGYQLPHEMTNPPPPFDFFPEPLSHNSSSQSPNIPLLASLPADEVLIQLIEMFLSQFYDIFPCFHKANLLEQVRLRKLQTEAPMLLYIICSIAAPFHPDPTIKACSDEWYEHAKFLYDQTDRDPSASIRVLQTAICLVSRCFAASDFSAAWLCIGKAWRQATALSLNCMDAEWKGILATAAKELISLSLLEKEEYRRVLWVLFIFDRAHTWPTGWAHAIDERRFRVNLPIDNTTFQAMSLETSGEDHSIAVSLDLDALVSTKFPSTGDLDVLGYLAIAHAILGKIVEHIHSLHMSPDSLEFAQECDRLDAILCKFRLRLPREATSVLNAAPGNRKHAVWLFAILNVMTILLQYRRVKDRSMDEDRQTSAGDHFTQVIIAARNIVQMIRDASLISTDLLLHLFFANTYYLAACVLLVEWRATGDPSFRTDIDFILVLLDRMADIYPMVRAKFSGALEIASERPPESIAELREAGIRGLIADCTRWKKSQAVLPLGTC